MTLYSIIKHKEKESAVKVKAVRLNQENEAGNILRQGIGQGDIKSKMEYVDLSDSASSNHENKTNLNNHEDKAKLLKIADTMIRSGADSKQILKVLPISEVELAALINNNKRD